MPPASRGFERGEYFAANPDVVNPAKEHPETVCISREAWLAKIKAALAACEGTDCICIARTHAASAYGMEEAITRCELAKELGAPMTMCGGITFLEDGQRLAARDHGMKMWPDVICIDGKPAVELADIKGLGFNFVTMHVFEKSALYGIFKYGNHDIPAQNVVFSTKHAMAA